MIAGSTLNGLTKEQIIDTLGNPGIRYDHMFEYMLPIGFLEDTCSFDLEFLDGKVSKSSIFIER